jgi:hypothetical protein
MQDIAQYPVPRADVCVPDAAELPIASPRLPHVLPVNQREFKHLIVPLMVSLRKRWPT